MKRKESSGSTRTSANASPYAAAATLLSQIIEDKKSFKKLVYGKDGELTCSKTTYAQVCQALSYKTILDQILEQVPKLQKDVRNAGLLHVCVYELLFGPNQKIKGGGAVKRKILQHYKDLLRALETEEIAKQLSTFQVHRQHCFPKYARINTLTTTADEVCESLLAETQKAADDEPSLEFYMDPHVPNLLVLPPSILAFVMATDKERSETPNTVLHRQQKRIKSLMESGKLILQDKSSCFSALCLAQGYDNQGVAGKEAHDYMDACAAPGNKTQHLATLIASQRKPRSKKKNVKGSTIVPTVFAMDRSPERLAALSKRMEELIPSDNIGVAVSTREADFLETKPEDFTSVGAIILDPSCSGSGIYTAPDRWTESNEKTDDRIEPLANFQEKALRHAMSFPSVFRIVYSTCSLHDRENEIVVMKALQKFNDGEKETEFQWHIVAPKCLKHWKRRGHVVEGLTAEDAKCMIRATNQDETNGFFVCCFEKRAKDGACGKRKEMTGAPQLVVPKGVEIYNGQFFELAHTIVPRKSTGQSEKTSASKISPRAKPSQTPEAKDKKNEQQPTAKPSSDKASKKRDKKLAWKKRQMEQKQERVQKKKLKISDGANEKSSLPVGK